jgi:hypothetical protein
MPEKQSGETEPVYLILEDTLVLYGLVTGATAADQRNREGP